MEYLFEIEDIIYSGSLITIAGSLITIAGSLITIAGSLITMFEEICTLLMRRWGELVRIRMIEASGELARAHGQKRWPGACCSAGPWTFSPQR
ncbi:hypothetical protein F8S13_25755 [Chloroflexia bacterium SDU3-3]|nr:hypothetical protein F8S13_25755 [Chloroflexia bacterium SDU3-3]